MIRLTIEQGIIKKSYLKLIQMVKASGWKKIICLNYMVGTGTPYIRVTRYSAIIYNSLGTNGFSTVDSGRGTTAFQLAINYF